MMTLTSRNKLLAFCAALLVASSTASAGLDGIRAVQTYAFLLPAVGCHRDGGIPITTNDKALRRLLDTGVDKRETTTVKQLKKAAYQGALRYDRFVSQHGRHAYCVLVLKHYGPKGTELPGLVDVMH